ncbi:MAG: hypothetical protein NVS1B4_23880 [Gemmatimonadaceae bacterium]
MARMHFPMTAGAALCVALLVTNAPSATAQDSAKASAARAASAAAAEFEAGQAAFARRDLDEAARRFERAAELAPGSSQYEMWKGRVYGEKAARAGLFSKPGLARRTKRAFDRAIALDPENLVAREYRLEYLLVAPRIMGGSTEKARAEAAEIGRRSPFLGLLASAHVDERLKRWADAERQYKEAATLQSDPPLALYRLGIVYQARGAYEEAYTLYEALVRAHPNFTRSWYQLGRTGAVWGQHLDRAEEALVRYLASSPGPDDPSPSGARFRLGQVYERKGNPGRARAEYSEAVRLDPGNRDASSALERIG